MKKTLAIILALAALTITLTACGSTEPTPTPSTKPATQNETPQTSQPSAEEPSKPDEPDVDDPQTLLAEFKSDFGYTISYEEDSFDYRRTEGYDEFILKSDAVDKPFVFVSISHVGAEFVEQVKTAALGENPQDCTIGQAQTAGQCSKTEEDWDGGKVNHKTYVCPLDSGDALLIETQWYTEESDDPYAAWLWEMVSSIQIEEN